MGKVLVFVYGTLMDGERNNRWMRGGEKICDAETAFGAALYGQGGVPYLKKEGFGCVVGEVWEVPERTLTESLDVLEGNPHVYRREREWFFVSGEADEFMGVPEVEAWVYVYQGRVSGKAYYDFRANERGARKCA